MKRFYPSKIGKYDDTENDDIYSCLEHNGLQKVKVDDIDEIIAEVCGENDSYDWWWIFKLRDGSFLLVSAGCDYTGWDCQSGINNESIHKTLQDAINASPIKEEYSSRHIRQSLQDQVDGKEAFGIYKE